MKTNLTDPEIIYKVYNSLSRKAKERLILSAISGRDTFFQQLNIECILIAINAEIDQF